MAVPLLRKGGRMADGPVWALGLMSGTSMDGVDAALIRTDGDTVTAVGPSVMESYDEGFRDKLRAILGARQGTPEIEAVERELTLRHADAVRALLALASIPMSEVAVIGFHGQTIAHDPAKRFTWQIGDGDLLACETGLPVVCDFRSADVAAGGEGAPFAPAYHQAIMMGQAKPAVVLNLGGVGNVTWMDDDALPIAFDTGPGNALIDDWLMTEAGIAFDEGGKIASAGKVVPDVLARLLDHPYFDRLPPKSLDRNDFSADAVSNLSLEDGAATLAAFTVESVAKAPYPKPPVSVFVTGGGRKNATLMRGLSERLGVPVLPIEEAGYDGDALEAQAFAFLAVRHLRGLPTSFPSTTAVPAPICGGKLCHPPQDMQRPSEGKPAKNQSAA
ncbi:anhydro-N-acetylmuramic acid kinase [Hwanghaeella grinnelliae]|uniref:Anhydro-N-acetylmuramic acid kinase n=1 Tax=Hwanghaeella grinnelliae TaxID=2500179 RepID=A0A437QU91_9PROT|nr:anhydro-N-acetylmuramic acid kinase [Hwanghaeella grinnelliae]RVU38073.1 anhydro-N-acetylmuramic acid kinase [Hwanghaeella grinnelliae]